MFKLEFLTNLRENTYEATHYFDSFVWAHNTSETMKLLLDSVEREHLSFFDRLELMKYQHFKSHSFNYNFKEIKMIYEN